MKGLRKFFLGLGYLVAVTGISALEIYRHDKPDLTGMALLAAGLASGMWTVMWGNAQEHKAAATKAP